MPLPPPLGPKSGTCAWGGSTVPRMTRLAIGTTIGSSENSTRFMVGFMSWAYSGESDIRFCRIRELSPRKTPDLVSFQPIQVLRGVCWGGELSSGIKKEPINRYLELMFA